MDKQPVIELLHVSKVFQVGAKEVEATTDVSLTVHAEEFVSVIGPSGCGKSTILRMVADIIQPTRGEVRVEGGTASAARKRRALGMVFQDPVLLPWRNLMQNVILPLEIAGKRSSVAHRSPQELISLVGLSGFESALPAQLSGGMKQRAAIARALLLNPSILLLDEPFGALDELTRQRLNIDLLRIWSESRTTALLVTHSISEAILLSDRVLVMTPRPARVAEVIEVDLPRPRTLAMLRSRECFDLVSQTSEALYEGGAAKAAPALGSGVGLGSSTQYPQG